MKTIITADDSTRATLTMDDRDTGKRTRTTFYVSGAGGSRYVRYTDEQGSPRQVCRRLASTGDTLMCDPAREPLADVIRREYRAMRRAEARS